jgi:hypothetical protein
LSTHAIVAGILAIGLGLPAFAAANQQKLPAAYVSISFEELDERTAAIEFANELLALEGDAARTKKRSHSRFRKFRVLNYTRALPVGKEDVIVQLKSPGKRKSIMTFELKF